MLNINEFALYLKVERDLSSDTIKGYLTDIAKFSSYIDCSIEEVTVTHIRSFIAHLTDKGYKRNTTQRALASLKAYFKYLNSIEKVIVDNPTKEVKLGNRERSLPKALSKADVMKLLEVATNDGLKSRILLELLYGLGGRVTEVASIKKSDIDFEECYIRIRGKGNKERHNPIHENCINLIQRYIENYGIESDYLFPHKTDVARHQTRESIFYKVKALAAKAGIDKQLVSPHVFRHSFATHMLDGGCDMAIVQEFLGHEDISTTRIYAQVTRGNKENNFKKFHPLAQ